MHCLLRKSYQVLCRSICSIRNIERRKKYHEKQHVSPEAERILYNKDIEIIPDILANSGGVLVSYYEWIQNKQDIYWYKEEVEEKLIKKMKHCYEKVKHICLSRKCNMRQAAFVYSLEKINSVFSKRK